jgi:hypothetical protein
VATVAQLQKQLAALQAQLEASAAPEVKRPIAARPWDTRRHKVVKGCITHTPKGATTPNRYKALTLPEAVAMVEEAYGADWVYAVRA